MAASKDLLVQWLRDAHAMESAAIEILEKQTKNLENYPSLKRKLEDHLEETKQQEQMVRECIEQLDTGTSVIKDTSGKLMGNMAAITNMMAEDEVVKNGIADFAFENFEIASYRSLVGAAEQLGETRVKEVCETILKQEEAMAGWLNENLPEVTQEYLRRKDAGEPAKR
jgi:ferritin-like metal-binding protein YciE